MIQGFAWSKIKNKIIKKCCQCGSSDKPMAVVFNIIKGKEDCICTECFTEDQLDYWESFCKNSESIIQQQ